MISVGMPERLKNIKPGDININDTIYIPEEMDSLTEYKITSQIREVGFWIEVDAIHVKTGLDDVLKFNPVALPTIFRSYMGSNWVSM